MTDSTERRGIDRRWLLDRTERDDPRTTVAIRSYEFEARHLLELRGRDGAREVSRSTYVVSPGAVVTDVIPERTVVLEATLAAGASTTADLEDDGSVLVEIGNGAVSLTPGERLGIGVADVRNALVQ